MLNFFLNQLLKQGGRSLAGLAFTKELNAPEVYVERIKKDFRVPDYYNAWQLYNSDPAYWARYYNAPSNAIDAKNEMVHDSAAGAGIPSRRNVFEYGYPEPDPRSTSGRGTPPDRASSSDPSFGRFGNGTASQAGTALDAGDADGSAARAAGSIKLADIRRLTRMSPTEG